MGMAGAPMGMAQAGGATTPVGSTVAPSAGVGGTGFCSSAGGVNAASGAAPAGDGQGCGLSMEQLQHLMHDEDRLQQYLADNPSMMKEIMKMM